MKHIPNREKAEFLKGKGLCFRCLSKGHMSKDCRKCSTCPVCQQRLPGILHIVSWTESAVSSALFFLEPHQPIGAGSKECMLAVVPVQVKLSKGSQIVQTYAFLDPGSSVTFCTEALMTQLNAKGMKMGILLTGTGKACNQLQDH